MNSNEKDGFLKTEDESTTNRSERKRKREKQRRFDLSNAFDELAGFISQVEPDETNIDKDKKRRGKSGDLDDTSGATRLEIIGKALKVMKRLHFENEERRGIIARMRNQQNAMPSDNVMVMVPTLAPVDEGYSVARATYPQGHPAYAYPHAPEVPNIHHGHMGQPMYPHQGGPFQDVYAPYQHPQQTWGQPFMGTIPVNSFGMREVMTQPTINSQFSQAMEESSKSPPPQKR